MRTRGGVFRKFTATRISTDHRIGSDTTVGKNHHSGTLLSQRNLSTITLVLSQIRKPKEGLGHQRVPFPRTRKDPHKPTVAPHQNHPMNTGHKDHRGHREGQGTLTQ
ncbi:UNVERIFIED_CONTAM: hypothetical protein Sindi_2498000 [Sesamum indicum]